tara:strand:+ start:6808 stop:7098 length:291 start_codon:yes stop_codon:yes gene_type:complete
MKKKLEVIIYATKYDWIDDLCFHAMMADQELTDKYIPVKTLNIEVTLSKDINEQITLGRIESLRKKKAEVELKATLDSNKIDEEINSLLAIESKGQ